MGVGRASNGSFEPEHLGAGDAALKVLKVGQPEGLLVREQRRVRLRTRAQREQIHDALCLERLRSFDADARDPLQLAQGARARIAALALEAREFPRAQQLVDLLGNLLAHALEFLGRLLPIGDWTRMLADGLGRLEVGSRAHVVALDLLCLGELEQHRLDALIVRRRVCSRCWCARCSHRAASARARPAAAVTGQVDGGGRGRRG